jgi:hypothetical protein
MDPQTASIIATTVVGFLSPYLVKAGEAIAKKIGEDIYHVLKARFSNRPAAQEALTDLEQAPNDADLQAALRVQLRKLLREDEVFAKQVRDMLDDAGKTEAGAMTIRNIAGDHAKQFGQVFGDVVFKESGPRAQVSVGERARINGNVTATVNVESDSDPS